MNVFHRYTRRSLRLSPARTLVTVIGIALSMSLFTAVIEGAYSGLQYLIRGEIEVEGAYHGYYYNLDSETKDRVLADSAFADAATWQRVGWAETGGSAANSYLLIVDAGDNLGDLLAVRLTQGSRMPENEQELLLPVSLGEPYLPEGVERYRAGDTVTFDVGRLLSDGEEQAETSFYRPGGMELTDTVSRTYTVVGYYWDFAGIPSLDKRIALTRGGGTGPWRVFFTFKSPKDAFPWFEGTPYGSDYEYHGNLLRYYGAFRNENLAGALYGFAGVLVFLIAFGSVSLIYNSFSISVSERTRQFGLLKSVGATKKQIKSTVLYEAFLLSAVGIPIGLIVGCGGIGITLWALRDFFNALFAAGDSVTTRIALVPNLWALVLSAAICLVTVLISAWIPARRAIRLTAIDAIRQSGDVRVSPREVRISPITPKLFGFAGLMAAKSFKRSRKRYRSTVFSLFLSVTLFISASSLCAYVTDTVEGAASGDSREDLSYTRKVGEGEDLDAVLSELTNVEGVTDGLYYMWNQTRCWLDPDSVTGELRRALNSYNIPGLYGEDGMLRVSVRTIFVNDETFQAMCADNGLNPEDYYDKEAPAALFYNRYITTVRTENGGTRWMNYEVCAPSAFPVTVQRRSRVQLDGYVPAYEETDAQSGETAYYYYPQDYYDSFLKTHSDGSVEDMDKSLAVVLTGKEAVRVDEYRGLTLTRELPFAFERSYPALIYPYSMMETVTGDEALVEGNWVNFAFLTSDHRLACENMSKLLEGRDEEVYDVAEYGQQARMVVTIVNVFAYGFIILISLIAAANVFNTISTNVSLRRREFAMLKSIGLSEKGFRKMMNYECMIYGLRGLLWGLPASAVMTYVIYRIASGVLTANFYIPWYSAAIAVGSVFAVVFATMLYATRKLRQGDLVEALKSESF